ncbi:hypothetical protein [Bradyrhizobium sp. SEMIA]|uniref:hypothetical protein n=1 Tax=Bradyrhizobium sp. SEMIA TaxID=2597515 RepID=UPI0018A5F62C|nr:hypothetical protein [Bradyrhizobium sp. SEMIA]QOG21756.1 hypothetical protein FOM02_35155 [Bradyrhizobium sp. SEMIA]
MGIYSEDATPTDRAVKVRSITSLLSEKSVTALHDYHLVLCPMPLRESLPEDFKLLVELLRDSHGPPPRAISDLDAR